MTTKKRFVSVALAVVFFAIAFCALGAVVFAQSVAFADGTQYVDVYAINDFHGQVEQMPKIAGFLAAQKAKGAVIINSGDMFQGSMESNSNSGRLLTDCMKEAGFDCMTYGNHEFDWGMDNLRNLASTSGIPFLGANIYNWNRTDGWGDFADDFADEYIIKEVNGVKVGVIGVIGKDQITSISSQLVQTIGFKEPLPIIKKLATELREQQDCDIVVVSAHAGPQGIVGEDDDYKKPSSAAGLEDYVDAMFCAHTHSEERYLVDGLPFLQGKRYGDFVSHVKFSVSNGNVNVETYENISYNSLSDIDATVQNKVQTLIDNSNAAIEDRNKVLGKLSGSLSKNPGLPRLVCNAIADFAKQQGYVIDLAIVNEARANISGNVTNSSLYTALPFDNTVYIAKVSGRDINKEMGYSGQSMWRVSGRAVTDSDKSFYYIAVIDYLLYHQNSERNYNYFPSAFTSGFDPIPLQKDGQVYNYRLITKDFLQSQTGTLDVSPYVADNNVHTNAKKLRSLADLPIEPYNLTAINNGNSGSTLPTWALVLIIVGAVLVVAAVVTVVVVLLVKRRKAVR